MASVHVLCHVRPSFLGNPVDGCLQVNRQTSFTEADRFAAYLDVVRMDEPLPAYWGRATTDPSQSSVTGPEVHGQAVHVCQYTDGKLD